MVHKPTLYQFLRKAGAINTSEEAIELVRKRKIVVDGRVMTRLDFQFNPKKSIVTVDGKPMVLDVPKRYFILNKPLEYITSKVEHDNKKAVMELIHEEPRLMNSLFPVGRLDYNTTGLLIITNDGKLANRLLDPQSKLEKEYSGVIKGTLTKEDMLKISHGFVIETNEGLYQTLPARIKIIHQTKEETEFALTLREGKKRQIRIMMQTLGHEVISLHRFRIGMLLLGDLPLGKYKEIKREAIIGI